MEDTTTPTAETQEKQPELVVRIEPMTFNEAMDRMVVAALYGMDRSLVEAAQQAKAIGEMKPDYKDAMQERLRMVVDAADAVQHIVAGARHTLSVLQRVEQDYTFFDAISAETADAVKNAIQNATPHSVEFATKYGDK